MSKYLNQEFIITLMTKIYISYILLFCLLFSCFEGYQFISAHAYNLFLYGTIAYLSMVTIVKLEFLFISSIHKKCAVNLLHNISLVQKFFLGYLLCSILSCWISDFPAFVGLGRHEGLLTIILYIAVFFYISHYGNWKNYFFYFIGSVVFVNFIIGLLQYSGYNPFHLYPEGTNFHDAFILYNGAFMGTLGNIDVASSFLCITTLMFYSVFLWTNKVSALLVMAVSMFLLTLINVTSGILGVMGAILLTAPFIYCKRKYWLYGSKSIGIMLIACGLAKLIYADQNIPLHIEINQISVILLVSGIIILAAGLNIRKLALKVDEKKLMKMFIVAIAMCVLLVLLILYVFPFSNGVLYEIHEIMHGNIQASFGSKRIEIWKEVFNLIKEKPWFGGGPDTLLARSNIEFSRYSVELATTINAVVDTAHNGFLNIAVNVGIPAVLFYTAALFVLLKQLLVNMKSNFMTFVFFPCIIAYLIQFCFTFESFLVSPLFWIIIAFCDKYTKNMEGKNEN